MEIREEIEEIESIMQYITRIIPQHDWPDSFLDYRIFAGFELDFLVPAKMDHSLQGRLEEVLYFCTRRVTMQFKEALNIDMRKKWDRDYSSSVNDEPNKPEISLNIDRLAKDIFCLYVFGRVDQLKDRIICKLEKIKI